MWVYVGSDQECEFYLTINRQLTEIFINKTEEQFCKNHYI
jgi:hypothetical protein